MKDGGCVGDRNCLRPMESDYLTVDRGDI